MYTKILHTFIREKIEERFNLMYEEQNLVISKYDLFWFLRTFVDAYEEAFAKDTAEKIINEILYTPRRYFTNE